MTTKELKDVLEEEHKDDDPSHREMWIRFVMDEVASGRMKPIMVDGALFLEIVYLSSTEVAEA